MIPFKDDEEDPSQLELEESGVVRLHPGQSEVFEDLFVDCVCRFSVAVCSRGWGKSFFAAVAAVAAINELLELPEWVPNKNVYIIAPTYSQVTDIYHPLIAYVLGMASVAIKHSKDLGVFWFPKEVTLKLVSFEAIDRLRGTGAYFVVCDEVEDWKKTPGFKAAWQGIIEPCIRTRWSPKRARALGAKHPGRALIIGTPKGYTYLYDLFNLHQIDSDWKSYHYDYTTSPYLDPEEILKAKSTIDPLEFAREYLASFEDSGNGVFYCFNRKIHVTSELVDFVEKEDVHIGIDFNVGIMAASVFANRGGQPQYLDEFKGHPDTTELAKEIKRRYLDKGHRVFSYPDPSGRSRKTSATTGTTDFSILQSFGIRTLAPMAAPTIKDSATSVNRKLKTASGDVNMFLHPRCVETIKSLERTVWVDNNADTMVIDKSKGVEHFSDGVRYATHYLWPVLAGTKRIVRGNRF